MDKAMIAAIDAACETARERCFPVDLGHGRWWIKRPRFGPGRGLWLLQMTAARALRLPILAPPAVSLGAEGLAAEARRTRALHGRGWPVPAVLGASDRWLILADNGVSIGALLAKAPSDVERRRLVAGTLDLLLAMHAAGAWHGGAQVRNFTWRPDGFGAIDFEDDLAPSMSLPARQARDIVLFLQSVAKWDLKGAVPLAPLAERALAAMDAPARDEADRAVRLLCRARSWVAPFRHRLGRDGRELVRLAEVLQMATQTPPIP